MSASEQLEHQAGTKDKAGNLSKIGFVVFMLALTALFVYLGYWQVNRLAQKDSLIAAVAQRIDEAPVSLPPIAEWRAFDSETYNFRPVTVTGSFDHDNTILVFTALDETRGSFSGPGFWVVAPLLLTGGGTVFVNRGFVPQSISNEFKSGGAGPLGEVTISGIARSSEEANPFTPGSEFQNRIEWVRNIARLLRFVEADLEPVAPIYIDAGPTPEGALPQGGETKLRFVNRHLEYAMTWFSLALLTPVLLIFWLRRDRKTTDPVNGRAPSL